MNAYVYIPFKTTLGCATVGYYDPEGEWMPESDHASDGVQRRTLIQSNAAKSLNIQTGNRYFFTFNIKNHEQHK